MIFAALLLALAAGQQAEPQQEILEHKTQIEGVNKLSARALLKAAVDEEADLVKNGFRRAEVDDMAFQMEMYALSQGFPRARVRWTTEVRDKVLYANFRVEE